MLLVSSCLSFLTCRLVLVLVLEYVQELVSDVRRADLCDNLSNHFIHL